MTATNVNLLASVAALSMVLSAAGVASARPPQDRAPQSETVVLVGCLQREPGARPAERDHYVLVDARRAGEESRTPSNTGGTRGTSGARNDTTEIVAAYNIEREGVTEQQVKALVGRRVEITGRLDPDDPEETRRLATAGGRTPRPGADELPDLKATAVRAVPGSCAAAR